MTTAITSSETVLRLRSARNRMIDALGLGETYPVRDLPVPNDRLTVAFDSTASIRVEDSEKRVVYQLRDKDNKPQGAPAQGDGGRLLLTTPRIHDDITFTVHARTPAGREADLLARAPVQVGLDLSVGAALLPAGTPQPFVIDFATQVSVSIPFSQDGVDYRLVRFPGGDPAHPDDMASVAQDDVLSVGGASVRGTGGAITLTTVPLRDDSIVRIRAIKVFDPALGRPPQTNVLTVRLPVYVRPNTALTLGGDVGPIADFGAMSRVRVGLAATGVEYRAVLFAIADAMYAQGAMAGPDLLTVPVPGQPAAMIRLPPPLTDDPQTVPSGYTAGSDWTTGTGMDLLLPLPAAATDTLIRVAVRKTHQGPAGPFVSALWLTAIAVRLVRPNPEQALSLTVTLSGTDTDGNLTVDGGQAGVYYTPRIASAGTPMTPPAYVHQVDPTGVSPWKGIGQLKLEVDLAVTRTGQPPQPPMLTTGSRPVGTALAIQAMRAQSRIAIDMKATAVIAPVTNVALQAALVDYGASAQVTVPASSVTDRFALFRELPDGDQPDGAPTDGNGATLILTSGALTSDTTLVLSATSAAAIPVRRRVRLPVAVRPNPKLNFQTRDPVIASGASTQILLDASEQNVSYQLMSGGKAIGMALPGTGAQIPLPTGPLTATTTFSIVANRSPPPAASVTLAGTAMVTVKS